MTLTNAHSETFVGVSRIMASPIPTRKVMMMILTFTSQLNHVRSSKVRMGSLEMNDRGAVVMQRFQQHLTTNSQGAEPVTLGSAPMCKLAWQLCDHREER